MVAAFLAELYFLLLATVAHAGQVVHDGTVGPAGALTGPAYVIPDTAGTTRGNNLFHSFSQFDLSEGDSATFTGPANIHNVIARVTGGPSTIDGALNCDIPGANFFFINPFGVIFGEHATVNVSGSFAVTTADYVKLADGGRFDARNPANDVLTAAPVSAFGFLGPTAAPIVIEGLPAEAGDVTMPVFLVDGKSLWVVGGDISLQGTLLGAPAGQIALVSVASAGELGVDVDNPHFQPDTSSFPTLGSVTLSDSGLYLTGVPGGLAIIEADQIRFRNAAILAGNDGDTRGGGVRLIARSEISLDAGSSISALALGDGDGGDVILAAPTIQLRNSSIGTTAVGNGNAGNVLITANDFSILDSAGISAENSGAGAGGNITIQADHVLFRGDPTFGVLGSQAGLTVQTAGGPAGSVHIEATTVELITGGRIVSDSLAGTSPGGAITIKAQTLTLDDHRGNGRTTISSQSIGGGVGGGNIVLDVGTLQVLNGAQITTTSVNAGPAGSINIHATDVTLTSGSIQSAASAAGAAGSITLDVTGTLQLNESQISVSAAQAAGGDITITAGNEIQLINSSLSAQANLDGGNITLTAPHEVYLLNSRIKAESTTGNGGNITIDPTFVVLNTSSLIANAITGNGGKITIDSRYFLVSDSLIDASSQFGVQGSIFITALNFDVTGNLLTLPGNPLDAEARLRPHCAIRLPHGASSFTVTGRSQLPAEPDGLLPAFP